MCRTLLASALVLLSSAALYAQPSLVVRPGSQKILLPPSVSADDRVRAFASSIRPDGTLASATDLYLSIQGPVMQVLRQLTHFGDNPSTNPVTGVTSASVAPHGVLAAYIAQPGLTDPEQLHVIDTTSGADRIVATDQGGCSTLPCVYALHLSPDERQILYAAGRNQPFSVAQADGSAVRKLPVASGEIAPSWQRVIASNGTFVFTNTNVYLMNLDGTGLRALTSFPENANIITRNATMSADGLTVAFQSTNAGPGAPNANSRIYTIRADGTGLTALTDPISPAGYPTLSGDGSSALYVQDGAIWKASTDGGSAPDLVQKLAGSALQMPVLAEDGGSFVAALGPDSGTRGAIEWFDSNGGLKSVVFAPTVIFPDGVVSAASGPPVAGSLISVYGLNFRSDNFSLLVNDQPVPVLAVTPWQINARLPFELANQNVTVRVSYGANGSPAVPVDIQALSPALFVSQAYDGTKTYWQAAALHADTHKLADATAPARAGETLELYGTGFGPVSPTGSTDPTIALPRIEIGGVPATVLFAGMAPGLPGIYQVNVVVPDGVATGRQPVVIEASATTTIKGDIFVS